MKKIIALSAMAILMTFVTVNCDKMEEIKTEAKKQIDRKIGSKTDSILMKACEKFKVGSSTWQDCRRKMEKNNPL